MRGHKMSAFILVSVLAAARLALADPTSAEGPGACPGASAAQARQLADHYSEQGAYQQAGECYRLAGDYDRANREFIRASRVSVAAGSHQLADDRDVAKAQWARLQAALHHTR
jgi:hypothetical protein